MRSPSEPKIGAVDEVADEEDRREQTALEVREPELDLDLRQDRREDEAIEIVEEVQPREQREDGARPTDHRGERTTRSAAELQRFDFGEDGGVLVDEGVRSHAFVRSRK